ncbi:hypothetical protein F4804DRAFT_349004 [Jackrogersella minutella]|nr:hypothetical protein F4804DRAFT_349004 [Jackrogersella minutella]
MADCRGSSFSYSPSIPMSTVRPSRADNGTEPIEAAYNIGKTRSQHCDQVNRRRHNNKGIIENPLVHLTDEELQQDVIVFRETCLPTVDPGELLRAARVAQNARSYDSVARSQDPNAGYNLPVKLSKEEKAALKAEKDVLLSQRGMFIVILTVSLAAFLQGFVQSSINGASLYSEQFGLPDATSAKRPRNSNTNSDDWKLGATNASPFFFAAVLGCWMSIPVNDLIGRRGAMFLAACLIFASSLSASWCKSWQALLAVRIVNGIGMGIKAVSTPILASETAVGFWRGSSILAWQLWVAFGIMIGFGFNLIFFTTHNDELIVKLILGAPFVPAVFLMVGLYFCPESPRYYMRRRSSSYNPQKAYEVLQKLRKTELQVIRDIYLVYKSVQLEEYLDDSASEYQGHDVPRGFVAHVKSYTSQYRQLFTKRRLRNALISSSIVALAQQLCGINIFAFYSGSLFSNVLGDGGTSLPMVYSLAFGAINFVFGLPAIRTIDTLGRRKWLVLTLPVMGLFLMAAALATLISHHDPKSRARAGCIALFVFLFTAAYSPGMGPIPFTLASESFPLSHREAGCSFAIAINLLFAGLIQMFFPRVYSGLKDGGSLGLFAGLNFLAFVLVFLFVEETKRRSLEDLDLIFAVRKRDFVRHQLTRYLPWFFRHHVLRRPMEKPSLYVDLIWNTPRDHGGAVGVDDTWNGFTSGVDGGIGNGVGFAGDDNVSPSFPRRPSGFMASEDIMRVSEDSNDSAHR